MEYPKATSTRIEFSVTIPSFIEKKWYEVDTPNMSPQIVHSDQKQENNYHQNQNEDIIQFSPNNFANIDEKGHNNDEFNINQQENEIRYTFQSPICHN